MAVIDATNLILGRMGSKIAKRALNGEDFKIVNSEKCVIIGKREDILHKFHVRQGMQSKGNPDIRGPKYPRMPDKILKRSLRGMLPYKRERGRNALKRIKTFIGVPKEIDISKAEKMEFAIAKENVSKMRIEEISKWLGARW